MSSKKRNNDILIDNIYKENPLLAEVIEKCLQLEDSDGMRRIVNRSLLDIYKNADHKYKSSQDFESVLKKTMINLDKDPNHKFSHIKHLCDLLRHGRVKKRAKLITLDKNVKSRFLFLYLHFRHEIVRPNLEARFCKSYQYLMVLNKILEYL